MSQGDIQILFWVFFLGQISSVISSVEFFVDDVETYYNPNYIRNYKLWIESNKHDHRKYRVNFEAEVFGVGNIFAHIKMYEKDKKGGKPTVKMFDYSIDICRAFSKTRKADIFYKFFLDLLLKYGKIPLECPIKDGFYYFYNLTMESLPFPMLSTFVFGAQVHYIDLSFDFYKKEKRQFVTFTNVTYFGGYYST